MKNIQVFISFDVEHDRDLYELLLAQSKAPSAGFVVLGGSEPPTATDARSERARRRIREADQVIVICGEHTEVSLYVGSELEITRQEQRPYILLWGRREIMCTKPIGAKKSEGMYSWTRQILHDQIALSSRKAADDAALVARRRPDATSRPG